MGTFLLVGVNEHHFQKHNQEKVSVKFQSIPAKMVKEKSKISKDG